MRTVPSGKSIVFRAELRELSSLWIKMMDDREEKGGCAVNINCLTVGSSTKVLRVVGGNKVHYYTESPLRTSMKDT